MGLRAAGNQIDVQPTPPAWSNPTKPVGVSYYRGVAVTDCSTEHLSYTEPMPTGGTRAGAILN